MTNIFDSISEGILFFLIPAIMGYLLVKPFKLHPIIIMFFFILMGTVGYFTYSIMYFSSIFFALGSGIAYYLENEKRKAKRGKR